MKLEKTTVLDGYDVIYGSEDVVVFHKTGAGGFHGRLSLEELIPQEAFLSTCDATPADGDMLARSGRWTITVTFEDDAEAADVGG